MSIKLTYQYTMKKIIFATLMVLCGVMLLASCSKDDEDSENENKNADTALIGTWVKKNPSDPYEINEAISFKQNGEVLIHYDGWYSGEYIVKGDGKLVAHVSKVRMVNFTWFDDYEAYAADNVYYDWYFNYSISGNTLVLYLENFNKTWTLEKM